MYRRTGFKCVVKCLRLRENKLIAFPIIAIAAHPVHVVPGSNNFLRSNNCESWKNSQFAIISRSQTFPILRYNIESTDSMIGKLLDLCTYVNKEGNTTNLNNLSHRK